MGKSSGKNTENSEKINDRYILQSGSMLTQTVLLLCNISVSIYFQLGTGTESIVKKIG